MSTRVTRSDLALLAARLVVGTVLLAHGLPKLRAGVGATAEGFAGMGVPLPEVSAVVVMAIEFGGGLCLLLGLATRIAGVAVAAAMAGAFWFAHRGLEPLASEGGWELVALIGVLGLVLAATGAGALSGDRFVAAGRPAVARERVGA
jgi:putative oxidoreductase